LVLADNLTPQETAKCEVSINPEKSALLLEAGRRLAMQALKQATTPKPHLREGPCCGNLGPAGFPVQPGLDPTSNPVPDPVPFPANPIPIHLNHHGDFLKLHFQEQQCRTGQRNTEDVPNQRLPCTASSPQKRRNDSVCTYTHTHARTHTHAHAHARTRTHRHMHTRTGFSLMLRILCELATPDSAEPFF